MLAIDIPGIAAFQMDIHPSGDIYISDSIRRTGRWESFETQVFARLLQADVEFFDIGANIGWYSLLAGRRLESRGIVHAFEPVPENVALLARNVAANALNNVRVNPYALGRTNGTTPIFLSADNKGDHRAYPSSEEGRQSIAAGLRRFDAYFDRSTRKPLVVKMDTQGFEYDVLLGMGDVLERHPAEVAMVIEFWPHGLAQNGAAIESLMGLLAGFQFTPWVLWEGEARICPVSWADLAAAARTTLAPATLGYVNLLLLRDCDGLGCLLDGLYSQSPSRLVPRTVT
ncbi:MAG TPA: FkbM family methyltransferase [Rhizomicrobium sp.]|nr:FkbM family methyltransferase [Rhizomicrobium sp.]